MRKLYGFCLSLRNLRRDEGVPGWPAQPDSLDGFCAREGRRADGFM
jgi:hypothetical protein